MTTITVAMGSGGCLHAGLTGLAEPRRGLGDGEVRSRAHLPATARGDAETAAVSIEDRIRVRRERLPEIDAWVAKRQAPLAPELPVVGELRGRESGRSAY